MARIWLSLAVFASFLISVPVSAEVYKCTQPSGIAVYQDYPCQAPAYSREEAEALYQNALQSARQTLADAAPAPGVTPRSNPFSVPAPLSLSTPPTQQPAPPPAPLPVWDDAARARADKQIADLNEQHRISQMNTLQKGAHEIALQGGWMMIFLTLFATGGAAVVAYLLFRWIHISGGAKSANELGRKWLAWMVAAATFPALTRFLMNFDVNFLAQGAVGVVVFGGLAYVLGWLYWKLIREAPWKSGANTIKSGSDNQFYEMAWDEIQAGNVSKGLWARSYAQAAGNDEKARALYVKERVKELRRLQ